MARNRRIHYTGTDEAVMWDRWQKGDSLAKVMAESTAPHHPRPSRNHSVPRFGNHSHFDPNQHTHRPPASFESVRSHELMLKGKSATVLADEFSLRP